jgi:hypothetical protein
VFWLAGSPSNGRHSEIEPQQADDRPDQTFGLAQGKAEYGRRVSAVVIARAE